MRPLSTEKQMQIKNEIIAIGFLMGFAYFIYSGFQIKGLGGEDLLFWSSYREKTFFSFLFSTEYTGFAPLYRLVAWLEIFLSGAHVKGLLPFHLFCNGLAAAFVYRMGRRISGRWIYGFFSGILFLLFGISGGQMVRLLGLQEAGGLWLSISIVYCLHIYLASKQEKIWYYHGACWLYFGACLVCQWYLALLPLFYLALLFRRRFQLRKWFWPLRQFLLVVLIRLMSGHTLFPEKIWQIPGFPIGLSIRMHILMWGMLAFVILLFAVFLIRILREEEGRGGYLEGAGYFLGAIVLFVFLEENTSGSDGYFLYGVYSVLILLLNYIVGVISSEEEIAVMKKQTGDTAEANFQAQHTLQLVPKRGHGREIAIGLFTAYFLTAAPFAWGFREKLFTSEDYRIQEKYNSLTEETLEKYGGALPAKRIYVLGLESMTQQELQEFFRVGVGPGEEAVQVEEIDTIRDVGLITKQMVVLWEDAEGNRFQDITKFVKEQKFKVNYGFYEDGWMDQECSFSIFGGPKGELSFRFLYPGILSGGEETRIYVDGELNQQLLVEENIYYAQIHAQSYQILDIRIESNFYVQEALEQRGESPLTALVEITAE